MYFKAFLDFSFFILCNRVSSDIKGLPYECLVSTIFWVYLESILLSLIACKFIYGSTALCWALAAFLFHDLLHSRWDSSDGRSARRKATAHTGQHKHRTNAHTDIHASSWIRTHDHSVWAGEDSSCPTPRGHCDRQMPVKCLKIMS
jgi:hypothetical protein